MQVTAVFLSRLHGVTFPGRGVVCYFDASVRSAGGPSDIVSDWPIIINLPVSGQRVRLRLVLDSYKIIRRWCAASILDDYRYIVIILLLACLAYRTSDEDRPYAPKACFTFSFPITLTFELTFRCEIAQLTSFVRDCCWNIVSDFCNSKVISLDFTHDHVFRKITLENCDFHQTFLATEW